MKIGVLQLNPVVGDLKGNAAGIARAAQEAKRLGADLCLTSEMALTGYPPRDLLLYGGFVERTWAQAEALARELADGPPLLLGAVEKNDTGLGKPVFNCALWCEGGEIRQSVRKTLLPTYDVFDEARYFEPAPTGNPGQNIIEFNGLTLAVTICEDAWNDKDYWEQCSYSRDPLEEANAHNPDLILNLSASPMSLGKQALRQDMLGAVARKYTTPLIYANQTGGNDDLVFDGRSCAFGPDGRLIARAMGFAEDVLLIDLDDLSANTVAEDDLSREAETWNALVLGTRDYVLKSGFSSALVGLSGGIDSAVTAAVAAEALGANNVTCVLMPSPYSSQGSIDDSLALAENLDIKTLTLPIEPIMAQFEQTLSVPFAGYGPDTTEENIQSRIRGNLLMALSNKYGSLLLTTGNKSELAVGYCTIYGDMSGGFAVISDVDKTGVFNLARWYNKHVGPYIPEAIITKPPSAELRPDQKDQDSLPEYDVLDAILELHIERHKSEREIVAAGFDRETVAKVLKLVRFAEFKRRQAAPGIKLTPRSFGTGWRMPLACKREL
ncbi:MULTISPECIES: NAD+ synthase [unclassified Pseudodesulfovibrio]|uniref:NAD+ synthase n=1 Tax=unclassified Pseudodesulfovibrio TaxID=2661612 RepID=UPI000FEB98C0|nr:MULTISPECIES: NAD+ synthase [unclassified Pseudodesulfovibrio]MCJ2165636.1 NAD+ synthase [Pseudodesulfovibrio sp. S3-i]RWU03043.1 NAD+ synthase [Pseudodesulfovibrio sp. S3]